MHQVFFLYRWVKEWVYANLLCVYLVGLKINVYICSTISKGLVDTSMIDKPGDPGHNVFKYEESVYSIHGFGG